MIFADKLCKHYGKFAALDACDLSVAKGTIFGLLGPNGAGKTTLIRCMMGFLKPTSGTAQIAGFDCVRENLQVREHVSYLPAEAKLFRTMKGKDCIEFFASIHPRGNKSKALEIARRLDLDIGRRVAFMSTGMRQKLAISCTLSCDSQVMILDEPTANLDPTVRNEVLQLVQISNQRGATVLFCSHVLEEIEQICQNAAILKSGRVVRTIDLRTRDIAHRIRGIMATPKRFHLPEDQIRWVDRDDLHVVFDIDGPLEQHLNWLSGCGLESIQVESIGLRSLYESIHRAPPNRPSFDLERSEPIHSVSPG